jgi:hypothetical protein
MISDNESEDEPKELEVQPNESQNFMRTSIESLMSKFKEDDIF